MHAATGDAIVVDSLSVGAPPRRGEILEVVHDDAGEHYRVRWDDGHETVYLVDELRALCRCAYCIGEPERPITG